MIAFMQPWSLSLMSLGGAALILAALVRERRRTSSLETQLALTRQQLDEARANVTAMQRDLLDAHHAKATAQRATIEAETATRMAAAPTADEAEASAARRGELLQALRAAREDDGA